MSEDGTAYAIRFRRRAQTEIQEALVRLAEIVSPDHAVAWHSGLQDALATLATLPKRCPIADEGRFFQIEVRVHSYRYRPGSATYHIFFTVAEADGCKWAGHGIRPPCCLRTDGGFLTTKRAIVSQ